MRMSRRDFMVSGAALGTAWVAGTLGACSTLPPQPQAVPLADGVVRLDLGGVTITMLSDGYGSRVLDARYVRNVPLAEVQAALRAAGLSEDRLITPYTALLADIGTQRVLFDAGNGEFGAATAGRLRENMGKAGIDPASVTAVVLSHFHGDHINGLRNKAGVLAFPKATLFAPEPEWRWWMDDARMAAAPEAARGPYMTVRRVFAPEAARIVRFEPGHDVLPGIRSLPAFGHTPGHTAYVIEGGQRKVLFWGDATNLAALFVRHPDWAVSFDLDAEAARLTRRRLAENLLVAGYHLPGAAIGILARRGDGYDFTPLGG